MDTTRTLVRPWPRGRRLPRLCAAALAAAALAGAARRAEATVTISTDVDRTGDRRPDAENPLWISREDCLTDNDLRFTVTLTGFSTSQTLEVWVSESQDCTLYSNRDTGTRCRRIKAVSPLDDTMEIELSAKEIAAALGAEGCEGTRSSTGAVSVTMYFMRLESLDQDGPDHAKWESTKMDLQGPKPPTEVEAHPGDGRLLVDFKQNEDEDVEGYYLYCDGGGQSSSGAGGAGAGGGDDGAGAAGGGSGGGATGAGSSGCQASRLVPGEVPESALRCGKVGKANRGEAMKFDNGEAIANGKPYVVGVAAYDLVGNAGPLSELSCATPVDVDGFFEKYRDAGGQAGGGFCSVGGPIGAGRWVSAPLGVLVAGAALGLWRRGRRLRARSITQESQ
ncbi:hypothetical protein WMF20_11815 [Sorangium sp. So ce834]|uniref:hypothetical protein n=1 Tax=Sorangium sp. So ce834 TaxID=3133321 RepID=UPI003F63312B